MNWSEAFVISIVSIGLFTFVTYIVKKDYDERKKGDCEWIPEPSRNVSLTIRLAQARVALQEIATVNTSDWCRPGPGLQGMAKEAISEIWKEEVIHAEEK